MAMKMAEKMVRMLVGWMESTTVEQREKTTEKQKDSQKVGCWVGKKALQTELMWADRWGVRMDTKRGWRQVGQKANLMVDSMVGQMGAQSVDRRASWKVAHSGWHWVEMLALKKVELRVLMMVVWSVLLRDEWKAMMWVMSLAELKVVLWASQTVGL